jgi:hypothetical protein
VGKEKEKAS